MRTLFLVIIYEVRRSDFDDALQYELIPHFSEVYSKKENLSALPVYDIRSERIIITTGTCLLDGNKCKKLEKQT